MSQLSLPLDEIIEIIKELPLKEALTYLAVNGIVKYSKKGYWRIKQIIQEIGYGLECNLHNTPRGLALTRGQAEHLSFKKQD